MTPSNLESQNIPIGAKTISLLFALCAAWAVLIAVTGGIDLRRVGLAFSSTDPLRPAAVALALSLVYWWRFGDLARFHLIRSRGAAPALAVMLAVLVLGTSLKFGTFVASAADPYAYVSQADLWLARDLIVEQPIARNVPWSYADWTFSPLGYRPSLSRGAIVPTHAPGTSLLMAASKAAVGRSGPYLVTPILGAVTVLLTYLVGTRVWSPLVGLAAAAWLAASPSFLYMLMWPMSDVPVAAFLTAAVVAVMSNVRGRAILAGILSGAAILIRPNLVLLLPVLGVMAVAREDVWRKRLHVALWFTMGVAPFVLAIAGVNAYLYGSPWQSGYGSVQELYRWRFFLPNLSRYPKWLAQSHTPLVLLCIVPLLLWRRLTGERRAAIVALATIASVIWLSYMFYIPFDDWWYLRFLLPALPLMLVLAAIGCALTLGRVNSRYRGWLLGIVAVTVAVAQINYALHNTVHRLCGNESVYVSVGEYVRAHLPPNAVILSLQHSGSLRLYGDRLTMRYDTLGQEWWPRAADVLTSEGLRPYVVLADFEEAPFRNKFHLSAATDAPGTVVAEITSPARVKIYDPLRLEARQDTIDNLERRICAR